MADAKTNRAIVEAARKRKPPPGGQQPKQRDRANSRPAGAAEPASRHRRTAPGRRGPGEGIAVAGQGGRAATTGRSQAAPELPRDARQQAQADAAAAAPHGRGLATPGAKAPATASAGATPETAAQRERRLANQAQLQRVPDDPGGLLRALPVGGRASARAIAVNRHPTRWCALLLWLCVLPAFAQTRAWLDRDRITYGETVTPQHRDGAGRAPGRLPPAGGTVRSRLADRAPQLRPGGWSRPRARCSPWACGPRGPGVLQVPELRSATRAPRRCGWW